MIWHPKFSRMGFDINLYHNPRLFITRVVNFRFISYRTETGIFSISIRYNNKLFTPLVLSINSRIFFFKCLHFIRLRESFMLFVILFFSSWKAGMFSMIVKQDAFQPKIFLFWTKKYFDYFSFISLQSPSLILDILLVNSLILLKCLGLITCRGIFSVLR